MPLIKPQRGDEGFAVRGPEFVGVGGGVFGEFPGDDRARERGADEGAEGAGAAAELFHGERAAGGHGGGEFRGGAVVVDAGDRLVDAYDAVGEVAAEELHQNARLRFGEGRLAGLERAATGVRFSAFARDGAGFLRDAPVVGRVVAVEVDFVLVEAFVRGKAIGVGDGDDHDGAADELFGMGDQPLGELGHQRRASRFVAVDRGDDHEHVGTVAVDFAVDGAVLDGAAGDVFFDGEGFIGGCSGGLVGVD